MKTVKIQLVGVWNGFDIDKNPLCQAIQKHYRIELSDEPDYIICETFKSYEYCRFPQVRILYSGENYSPDFNLVDYAVSPYPISFQDRHIFLPYFIDDIYGHSVALGSKDRAYDVSILREKPYFANFIASHESEYNIRGDFFKALCKYKRVEAPGSYLNNMDTPVKVSHLDSSKADFQRKCKFTLCFESTKHEGFITEKITDAFFADTIPVYFGSSSVNNIFNKNAFINVADYSSFDKAIQRIIELDSNDEKYLEMLRQPIFVDDQFVNNRIEALEKFVTNIFDQPLEQAYRRSRVFAPKRYEDRIIEYMDLYSREKDRSLYDDLTGRELLGLLKKKIENKMLKK